jgi:hypothetical protein
MNNTIRCDLRLQGGLALSTLGAGVVTRAALMNVCEQTVKQLGGIRPQVFLADFRRPIWALSVAHLDAFFDGANSATEAPAALVVDACYLPLFKSHAWNVAQGGIMRKIFTDYESAARWAALRVDLARPERTVP